MNNLIQKLISEDKITEENGVFLEELYYSYKQDYDYLRIKDETWVKLFNNIINAIGEFKEGEFSLYLTTHISKYIRNKLKNNNTSILDNYLKKLMLKNNNYNNILKQFFSFLDIYDIQINDQYLIYLKTNLPRFNTLLEDIGIDDFDYNLLDSYINGYFDLLKSLRFKKEKISDILAKYLDVLKYSNIPFSIDVNDPLQVTTIKNNEKFKQLKLIFSNFELINKIYLVCKSLNNNIDEDTFKYYIYNYSYNYLNTLFSEYTKYISLRSSNLYNNKFITSILGNEGIVIEDINIINELYSLLNNNGAIDKKQALEIIKKLYNEEHYLNQYLLKLYFTSKYKENNSLSHKVLVKFMKKYKDNVANIALEDSNIYRYILKNQENNLNKRKYIDLLLSKESADTINKINLYFENKLKDSKTRDNIINKINLIKDKYYNTVGINNPLTSIYDYLLYDRQYYGFEKLKLDYIIKHLDPIYIKTLNDYFNDTLPKEEYINMLKLYILLRSEYKNWKDRNVFTKTNDKYFNELYHYLSKEDKYSAISKKEYPYIKEYFQDKITDPLLNSIIVYKLTNYYDTYLNKINNNSFVIDCLANKLNMKREIIELIVAKFYKREFKILNEYFVNNEESTLIKNLMNYIKECYNYYLYNGKLSKDYYLINLLQDMNLVITNKEVLA